MNAAAKYINQSSFFHGQFASIRISFFSSLQMALIIGVLLSALAVIYVTNMQRMTCSQFEKEEQITHQQQLKWGRLMLEKASLVTPYRIEKLAQEKLDMVLPEVKHTMILRSE
ncbi:MAG: cell division protein FtsL [Legionellales bacterium RIFCSPHIGHO2_12_FULL_35_11]|nr:MAG: cell division protein FtsL [Legionellales bacterium RIFCSPHIGHO2_12_FULL_35_11]